MKLVSIVVCTYNGSKYIETQIQSLLEQTYSNIEIIIADDSSTDNTVSIVTNLAKNHNNLSVHSFKENLGYIKNFERGILLANGDYIALCDQDDWWHPTKIEKLVANISDYDIIYCNSEFTNALLEPNGNSFSKSKNMITSKNPLNFVIENCVSGHASIIKKELIEKSLPFPDQVPHDWWLTFIATLNNGVTYYDEALVKYRFHDNNVIVSKKNKVDKKAKKIERRHRVKTFYEVIPENNKNKKILKTINNSFKSFSIINNIKRAYIFLKHREDLLAILKKSDFKKRVFAYTMFFKLK
ncbi:hypothetical protein GCM10022271_18300 [Corallibacter vietnamensis]|uniref:Glycosyltransferase 2-like domain-containing protein n=1 Tax=Corallibacter vietnamensis TaxID=904130 RepID=A0ABP7H981_9FLAO